LASPVPPPFVPLLSFVGARDQGNRNLARYALS
jgi:hypothetical protein